MTDPWSTYTRSPGDVFVESEVYSASVLPRNHPERVFWQLLIERHDGNLFTVKRHRARYYDRDGNSAWIGGLDTDEERARFLMTWAEAMTVVQKICPTLTVNGHSVSEVIGDAA